MGALEGFFPSLSSDIRILNSGSDTSKDDYDKRWDSVAFRIGGIAAIVFGAIILTVFLATSTLTPLNVVLMTAFTALDVVLGYDLMVIGHNQSRILAVTSNPAPNTNQGFLSRAASVVADLGSRVFNGAEIVVNELSSSQPYPLKGTILVGPVYKCFNK